MSSTSLSSTNSDTNMQDADDVVAPIQTPVSQKTSEQTTTAISPRKRHGDNNTHVDIHLLIASSSQRIFKHYGDRRLPPCISERFSDTFLALRNVFEFNEKLSAKAIRNRDAAESSGASSSHAVSKKGSLRRIASAFQNNGGAPDSLSPRDSSNSRANDKMAVERHNHMTKCVQIILKDFSSVMDNFVRFVVEMLRVKEEYIVRDITYAASYFLLDESVTQHPELTHLKICDNTYAYLLGKNLLRVFVLKESLARGSTVMLARRRYKRVINSADAWLLHLCGNSVDKVKSITPPVWRWDDTSFDELPDTVLNPILLRCRKQLPCILIGILDLLLLQEWRDDVLFQLYDFCIT